MQRVWNAINSKHFENSKPDIINCLIEEIYYSKNISQKENIFCPSTVYERIIYCLAGFNPELIDVKLDCVLNYEIMMFSIKLKDTILKSKDKKFVSTYNSSLFLFLHKYLLLYILLDL